MENIRAINLMRRALVSKRAQMDLEKYQNLRKRLIENLEHQQDVKQEERELKRSIETILADYDSGPENSREQVTGIGMKKSHGNSGFSGGCTLRLLVAL